MNYYKYIQSPAWDKKRKARLEIDGHECRLCGEDGTRFRLEVHHKPSSYKLIPLESVEHDLTVLCSRCHELITSAIRSDRYGQREYEVETIPTNVIQRKVVPHGLANFELQIDGIRPASYAQRADGRPNKQVVKIDQTDFIEEGKNRRGLRGDGAA